MRSRLLAVLWIALATLPASAWNAAGHMTVAKLAWDQLDAKDRQTLYDLLQEHPHWDRFFINAGGRPADASPRDYQFALASTWADWLRGFSKPRNDEEKQIYRHHVGPRHYINWPFVYPKDVEFFRGKELPTDPTDDIIKGLDLAMAELKATQKFSRKERAVSLCWLLHLAGDVHQPLHNIGMYSLESPTGDQGGNLFWVKDAGQPVRLHGYWDDLFGREDYDAHLRSYDRAVRAAAYLSREAFDRKMYTKELQDRSFESWSKGGFRLAVEVGYRSGKLPGRIIIREHESEAEKDKAPELPNDYHARAMETANRQAALAGHRLADLLREVAAATRKE